MSDKLRYESVLGYYNLTSGKDTDFESFFDHIYSDLKSKKKHNKVTLERLAETYGIYNKNIVKETTEFAIVKIARSIAIKKDISDYDKFNEIVELYHHQVNLSHRTTQSMLLQQYSTPVPIGYIASLYVSKKGEYKNKFSEPEYFEPSAGNGLLTIALLPRNVIVNEIDEIRRENLERQNFRAVMEQDATLPFIDFYKKFDGIITNPPFGTLDEPINFDDFKIKTLDHLMALRALDTLKDSGKAAIIIGGHTDWDEKGRIQAGKNRIFFNYLYSHYNVEDVIQIDGHKLYSRQGTAFDVSLILINGRKLIPEGVAPLKNSKSDYVIDDFDELWKRIFPDNNTNAIGLSDDKLIEIMSKKIPVMPLPDKIEKYKYLTIPLFIQHIKNKDRIKFKNEGNTYYTATDFKLNNEKKKLSNEKQNFEVIKAKAIAKMKLLELVKGM
jgi:predicted RNA methylase